MVWLSVIMPNYNGEEFIRPAIQSVLDQGIDDVEVLVIDDQSEDRSVEFVQSSFGSDPRVKLLKNNRKKGVSGARNTGIEAGRGEWFLFLDSDDLLTPGALSNFRATAQSNNDIDWIVGDFCVFDGEPPQEAEGYVQSVSRYFDKGDFEAVEDGLFLSDPVRYLLQKGMIVNTGNFIARRSLIKDTGLFREGMRYGEDLLFWFQMGLRSKLLFIPAVVRLYRRHETNVTQDVIKTNEGLINCLRYLHDDPAFSKYADAVVARLNRSLDEAINHLRRERRFADARGLAWQSLRLSPLRSRAWKNALAVWLGIA